MKRLSLSQQRSLTGYLFTLPFIIGFILFFLAPFIQSVIFSLNHLRIVAGGYELIYNHFENFKHAVRRYPVPADLYADRAEHDHRCSGHHLLQFLRALLLNQKFRVGSWPAPSSSPAGDLKLGGDRGLGSSGLMSNLMREQATNATSFLAGPTLTVLFAADEDSRELLLYVISVVDRIPRSFGHRAFRS